MMMAVMYIAMAFVAVALSAVGVAWAYIQGRDCKDGDGKDGFGPSLTVVVALFLVGVLTSAIPIRPADCRTLLDVASSHRDSLTVVSVHSECLWERADTVGLGEIEGGRDE